MPKHNFTTNARRTAPKKPGRGRMLTPAEITKARADRAEARAAKAAPAPKPSSPTTFATPGDQAPKPETQPAA